MTRQPLAWVAVAICAAPQATAQAPSIDLSSHTVETVVPPEFDGGFLHRVVEIVVRDKGVWVNDIGRLRLFQFDHTGRLVVEYGRQGSGPGEFLMPGGLHVDSVVTVIDQRQKRIVRFGLDGEHLDTRRMGASVTGGAHVPVGWTVPPLRNGVTAAVTLGWYSYGGNAVSQPFNHVLLAFPGVAAVDTIATYHFGNARWQAGGSMGGFNPRFGEGGAWAAMGDSAIVVADGVTGLVVFFTARTPRQLANVSDISAWFAVDTVSLGFSARLVSPSDRARAERDLRRAEPNLPARVDLDGWPEHWSVATDLLVADDGNVWARQVVGGDGRQHWTEVDRDGPERRQYVLPERFRLLAVAGGALYGVAVDELGVQSVGKLQLPNVP